MTDKFEKYLEEHKDEFTEEMLIEARKVIDMGNKLEAAIENKKKEFVRGYDKLPDDKHPVEGDLGTVPL